jgi:hypothetical protein
MRSLGIWREGESRNGFRYEYGSTGAFYLTLRRKLTRLTRLYSLDSMIPTYNTRACQRRDVPPCLRGFVGMMT